jgi:AcrR family transcriptional regulator
MKSASAPRTQEDRSRTTAAALLGAAETLFGLNGYAATGLDDIAARAGVTKGALYHHFPTGKSALFEAVVLRIQARLTTTMDEAAKGVSGIAGFKHVLDVYFRIAAEPEIYRITLLDAPSVLGPDKWREIEHRHALRYLRMSVDDVLGQTKSTEAEKAMLAQAFFGAAYEAIVAIANAADRAAARRVAVDTIAAIVEGAYMVLLRPKATST